jgi:Tfp pilus assembly protein PilO
MKKLPVMAKWSALSRRERLMAMAGLLVISLVLIDRAVLAPWWRYTQRINEEIHKLDHEIASRARLLSRSQEIRRKVEAFQPLLRAAKPHDVEMGELVREVETLAAASGVLLGPVAPQPADTAEGPYQEMTLDVQYQGTVEQAVRFIYLIEASKSLFRVERATLALEKRDSELLKGSVRLTSAAVRAEEMPRPVLETAPGSTA